MSHNNAAFINSSTVTLPGAMKEPKKKSEPKPRTLQRAKSSFFLYCDHARKKAKDENPAMTMAQISSLISLQWKNLSDSEKKPYIELAKKKKEEFDASKPAPPVVPAASKKLAAGWKKAIDASTGHTCYIHGPSKTINWFRPTADTVVPFVPQKAKSAYNYFASRTKAQDPKCPLAKIAELWKGVSGEEKAECERLARADKVRFELETKDGSQQNL